MLMPHWPVPTWRKCENKSNLSYLLKLSTQLGNPHLKMPPIIHIAGTNGKGSSVAMLKSIFENANYKVHSYTSPHLFEFNERIVLAGDKINDEYLFDVLERTKRAASSINLDNLSFFDGITVAAYLAFSEIFADILIVETGIGGRLDATNIIENPIISIITSISYDHMDFLGLTLQSIATEKAGIIKPHTPCITSLQTQEVYDVIIAKCQKLKAPLFCYEYDFCAQKSELGFVYLSNTLSHQFSMPSLHGDHQITNAATVIAAINLLNHQFKINVQQIDNGLREIDWPARIEKIDNYRYSSLISSNINIWLDGAHNLGGAQALANWLRSDVSKPIYLILGMTKNRDVSQFCQPLVKIIKQAYSVKVLSEASSYSAEILSDLASPTGINILPADSIEAALQDIDKELAGKSCNVIITGSLYLASDLSELLKSC
ncbi:MAG: bifunctional folylpolyglutamate synthase/dihydrofolate synthase [Rickettsiaceae bacterium]|nr:MAG: bifunctional folylpolyglutamate synthase/dihydrofolate synthase [Rickettsiaceae bacterium]